jgi:cytochrome c551/c552
MAKKIILIVVVAGLVLFGLIQLVPYGRNHTNPPVVQEIQWDSSETRALAERACLDCHSNQTVWPWYSNIAPASWLLAMDTSEARDHMNFSDWGSRPRSAEEIARQLERGSMPPSRYLALHPEARLSDAEIAKLIAGFRASIK